MISTLRFIYQHPLNRVTGRMKAFFRFFLWQVRSRVFSDYIPFQFIENSSLYSKSGMTGATGNYYCGLHEFEDMAFLLHVMRKSDRFLDIGANVGSYTVLASGGVGAQSYSFEPLPSTFHHLNNNVLKNNLCDKVKLFNCGLSNCNTTLNFSSGLDTVNHVLSESEIGKIPSTEVPVRVLDEMLDASGNFIAKIDVEGHELSVLQGAEKLLASGNLKAVIMELNGSGARYGVSDEELRALMSRNGFAPYRYEPFSRALNRGEGAGGNTIFVSDIDFVRERVMSSPKYLIGGRVRL